MKYGFYQYSLRMRLGLGLTVVLTLLLLVYGVIAYEEFQTDLLDTAEAGLRAQVIPSIIKSGDINSNGELKTLAANVAKVHGSAQIAVWAYNKNGELLSSAGHTERLGPTIRKNRPDYAGSENERYLIENGRNGRELIFIKPIHNSQGSMIGLIETRTSLAHVDASLGKERFGLILGGVFVLLLALLMTHLVIGVALRPLTNLASTIQHIATSDLTSRSEVPPGDDEVAKLVTAFNAMLDRLESAFDAQRRANDEVRQFTANASHELRSHLTVVTGYMDVMQRGAASDLHERERVLNAARNELSRLAQLVDDLLTLARLGSGAPLQFEPVNMGELIKECVQEIRMISTDHPIELRLETAQWLMADPLRVRQIVRNLLENAIKHTPSGTEISIGLETREENLCFWVKDNGPGISVENLPHVFERFWRADTSRQKLGSGLGLPIVAVIAEAHKGRTFVESRPGQGATFTVCLPLSLNPNQ